MLRLRTCGKSDSLKENNPAREARLGKFPNSGLPPKAISFRQSTRCAKRAGENAFWTFHQRQIPQGNRPGARSAREGIVRFGSSIKGKILKKNNPAREAHRGNSYVWVVHQKQKPLRKSDPAREARRGCFLTFGAFHQRQILKEIFPSLADRHLVQTPRGLT